MSGSRVPLRYTNGRIVYAPRTVNAGEPVLYFIDAPTQTDTMRKPYLLAFFAASALATAAAAQPSAQIPTAEYTSRRDSLAARIGDGVVVAFGGRTPTTDFGPFYQLPAFHYLTNFDEPDAAFVLVARGGRATTTFFLTPIDPRTAFYYGRRPDSTSVERTLGVKARSFSAITGFGDSVATAR